MSIKSSLRDNFILALQGRQPPGRVPHFELVFFLTMEAFGKVHPAHRSYHQWDQMEEKERQLHRRDMAQLYIDTAERYGHSAIFIHLPGPLVARPEEYIRVAWIIRELTSDKYFLMKHGDATYGIPGGEQMVEFSLRLVDESEKSQARSTGHGR